MLHRRLVERADDGRRLVTERGPLLRLAAAAQSPLGEGALRAEAAVAAGTIDYDGQTQAGVPLATRSGQRDLEAGVLWRPLAPARWGEAWLVLRGLQQRRQIAATPGVGGLRETSWLLQPGLRWAGSFEAAGWQWAPALELRASVRHRLDVDFHGVFDTAELKGGRRRELQLSLEAAPAASPWRFGLAWSHARQAASPSQALSRAGVPVRSVRQPRIVIDDVLLRVGRVF